MSALRDFAAELLEREGAAIEPIEPDELEAVVPEHLRRALSLPEFARLGFGAASRDGAMRISLEGEWLDRFGALLGERGRCAERQLSLPDNVYAPGDPERLLDRALDLPNASWRLHGSGWTWTRCRLLAFRYTAVSDEKREGLVWLGFNEGTGAALDGEVLRRLRAYLETAEWLAPEPSVRGAAEAVLDGDGLKARVESLVAHRVRRDLEPFLATMRRRLDRDCARIHQYHNDLRRAAQVKLGALEKAQGEKAESDRKREILRIKATEREYAAKLNDLRHNYALRVNVGWTQALTLFAPVYRYELLIKRRKGERIMRIDWHPSIRTIEPAPCDWGTPIAPTRYVCDDRLHLTGADGQAPCPSCGKAFCRACHPAGCPRCGRAV
jgi:hypothetical protein